MLLHICLLHGYINIAIQLKTLYSTIEINYFSTACLSTNVSMRTYVLIDHVGFNVDPYVNFCKFFPSEST